MKKFPTRLEFSETVISNFLSFPLNDLFLLDDSNIKSTIEQWNAAELDDQYQQYIIAELTLPKGKYLNFEQYAFYVARDILYEVIVCMAESYFYDEYFGDEPKELQPFTKGPFNRMDDATLKHYFKDIFDVMHDTVYNERKSTWEYLSLITQDLKKFN